VFNWLFKRRKPKQIEDEVFGRLDFVETKNAADSFWEGKVRFLPTEAEVAYFIKAGDSGPCEEHRVLYRDIGRRYGDLLLLVTPLLQREFATQMASCGVSVADPVFVFEILHMAEVKPEPMEWSMDFSCGQWDDALFKVHMKGWEPTGEISVMD
jgi:hypothetical protein